MAPAALLSLFAAVLSVGLALFVALRGRRSFSDRTFVAGMLLLAAEEVVSAFALSAALGSEALRWYRFKWSLAAFVPGVWLLFSLGFARANYRDFFASWKWVLVAAFAIPALLVTAWGDALVTDAVLQEGRGWRVGVGWSGFALTLVYLLLSLLVLMNLESTLRASTGTGRWKIKFMLLGVAAYFSVKIYVGSQTLLYSAVYGSLTTLDSAALVVGDLLMAVSLWRSHRIKVDLYLSETAIRSTLTLLMVGAYLLAVGGLAKAVSAFGDTRSLPFAAFVVFIGLMALAVALLSDDLRNKLKAIVSRHLQRPKHDHWKVWRSFTRRTGSVMDVQTLCAAIVKLVSETFGVSSVSIWLTNEAQDGLALGASTYLSEERAAALLARAGNGRPLLEAFRQREDPTEIEAVAAHANTQEERLPRDFLHEARLHYGASLVAGGQFLGLLTVNARITNEPFSTEDLDLLKNMADQAAAHVLNLRLSERLLRAKQMEAFQTLSAFFVHDLKNLASQLSLTMQNLPEHYEEPAFRQDLLRVISKSVDKINRMTHRLSPLSRDLEPRRGLADLNQVVADTLAGLNGSLKTHVVRDLEPVPQVEMDPEGIRTVLTNLVLNADEASAGNGEIRVSTREQEGWVVLTVSDRGCGMPTEFLTRSLFRPFETTKKRGLGIGLFHSRKIVEAHEGRIEVHSEAGKGSTFRVFLPVGKRFPGAD